MREKIEGRIWVLVQSSVVRAAPRQGLWLMFWGVGYILAWHLNRREAHASRDHTLA